MRTAPCIPRTWGRSPRRPWERSRVSARSRNSAARTWSPTAWAAIPRTRKRVGVGHGLDLDRRQAFDDDSPAGDGLGDRERCDVSGVLLGPGQALGDRGNSCRGLGVGVGPPATQCRTQEQVEREVDLSGRRRALGHGTQLHHPAGISWDPVVEDLPQPLDPCSIEIGQRGALGFGDQSVHQVDATEPEADLRGQEQPPAATGRVGRQLGRPLESGDGGVDPPTSEALCAGGFELVRHIVVRPRDGQGPMPGSPVRLVDQDVGECGVSLLPARHGLCLHDA